MEQKQQSAAGGVSHLAVEAVTAAAIFAVGVVMMVDNYKLGSGWADDGPEAGYFPFRIGAILCVASFVVLARTLFGRQRKGGIFVTWQQLKLVMQVFVPTAAYVLVTQFLGIYVASTLFIAGFMRAVGKSGWLKTLVVSIGVSLLLFWTFESQFSVPLRKGPLEAWFGY